MSRSCRKTPIIGITTARSDKPFKADEHGRERAAVRRRLCINADDTGLPHAKAFGNPWAAPKDGKIWLSPGTDREHWLRK